MNTPPQLLFCCLQMILALSFQWSAIQYSMQWFLHLTVEHFMLTWLHWQSAQTIGHSYGPESNSSNSLSFCTGMHLRDSYPISLSCPSFCELTNMPLVGSSNSGISNMNCCKILKCHANTGSSSVLAVVVRIHHLDSTVTSSTEEKLPKSWWCMNSGQFSFGKSTSKRWQWDWCHCWLSTQTATFHLVLLLKQLIHFILLDLMGILNKWSTLIIIN